jgi:hypothetical protein
MNIYLIADIIGIVGVSFIIMSYFLLQHGKISSDSVTYLTYNLIGAVLVLFSLFYHWNLASVIIEIMWLGISIYGLIKIKFYKKP